MMQQVAVVTGAGSGIGRAVALRLLDEGWCVVLAGRRVEALRQTLAMARDSAPALVFPADVTDEDAVTALIEAAVAHFGRLDLVFNNAGTFEGRGPIEALGADVWRKVVDINLTGAFLVAQAAYRQMKGQTPQGGRIINNGSVSAHAPRPHTIAYAATKHAMTGLTKAIALEGRAFNIACGQIDTGNAATDMTQSMATGMLQADGAIRSEPRMDVAHVAEAVLTMARLPLDANILSMTITATAMPYVGRG